MNEKLSTVFVQDTSLQPVRKYANLFGNVSLHTPCLLA